MLGYLKAALLLNDQPILTPKCYEQCCLMWLVVKMILKALKHLNRLKA